MGKIYKLGIVGLVHDHVWSCIENIKKMNNAEIICIAENNPVVLKKAKAILDNVKLYKTHSQLLNEEEIDVCLVFTETCKHAQVTEACAKKGIHVMVEKPMAVTFKDAKQMLNSAEKSKIKLMVNFPTAWNPNLHKCYEVIKSGKIGRVWMIRWRDGHQGPKEVNCSKEFLKWLFCAPKSGGGALVDFGCYGAEFTALCFGRPVSVTAVADTLVRKYLQVEDNAVIITKYAHPTVLCNIEGTWSQIPGGLSLHILGEKGSIVKNPLSPVEYNIYTQDTKKWELLKPSVLAQWQSEPIAYFLHCIEQNLPIEGLTSPYVAIIMQEILEAAKLSVKKCKTIKMED
ncbi:MAG: Gfo/Idh/MocA family oxidoreductase [Candidatus Firestonebacteria bacterium]